LKIQNKSKIGQLVLLLPFTTSSILKNKNNPAQMAANMNHASKSIPFQNCTSSQFPDISGIINGTPPDGLVPIELVLQTIVLDPVVLEITSSSELSYSGSIILLTKSSKKENVLHNNIIKMILIMLKL